MRHRILSEEPITVQEIIEIHTDIIRDFGGASGIRDDATLDYVMYQVNRSRMFFMEICNYSSWHSNRAPIR